MRVAVIETGPQIRLLATPSRASGSRNHQIGVCGSVIAQAHACEAENSRKPSIASHFGLIRVWSLPTTGARPPDSTAIGIMVSAAWVGVSPFTSW